ncbi:uncharacterized protein LOC143785340 [Ranitomeya variabilis]|uniref:uncharacterized protein LOC143785340 n=1 Tax=Ranitomeya variabilis TaxID=490064 RepID=UPI004056CCC1
MMRQRRERCNMETRPVEKGRMRWHRWELLTVSSALLCLLYIWIWYENFHFHVSHFYAHLGYSSAQHVVGQRYLRGAGIRQDPAMASYWISRAAAGGGNQTLIFGN